jgi:hypothetical protein
MGSHLIAAGCNGWYKPPARERIHEPIQKTAFLQHNGKVQGNTSLLNVALHG